MYDSTRSEELRKIVATLLEAGIIKISNTPY